MIMLINCLRLGAVIIYTLIFGTLIVILSPLDRMGGISTFLSRLWGRLILITCGVRVAAEGMDDLNPERVYVVISNHQSHFDVPALFALMPLKLRFVAKKELARIPVFGMAMRRGGHIIIDRSRSKTAIDTLRAAEKRIIHQRLSPLFFAEGTRSADGSIGPFKRGGFRMAMDMNLPILALSISGSRKVLPKGSLRISPGNILIKVVRVFYTEDREDMEKLMGEVREDIVSGFDPTFC